MISSKRIVTPTDRLQSIQITKLSKGERCDGGPAPPAVDRIHTYGVFACLSFCFACLRPVGCLAKGGSMGVSYGAPETLNPWGFKLCCREMQAHARLSLPQHPSPLSRRSAVPSRSLLSNARGRTRAALPPTDGSRHTRRPRRTAEAEEWRCGRAARRGKKRTDWTRRWKAACALPTRRRQRNAVGSHRADFDLFQSITDPARADPVLLPRRWPRCANRGHS